MMNLWPIARLAVLLALWGKQAFSFIWEINSSENPPVPTPEDPDAGLWWVPKTKTTQQDLLNILRTAIFN